MVSGYCLDHGHVHDLDRKPLKRTLKKYDGGAEEQLLRSDDPDRGMGRVSPI